MILGYRRISTSEGGTGHPTRAVLCSLGLIRTCALLGALAAASGCVDDDHNSSGPQVLTSALETGGDTPSVQTEPPVGHPHSVSGPPCQTSSSGARPAFVDQPTNPEQIEALGRTVTESRPPATPDPWVPPAVDALHRAKQETYLKEWAASAPLWTSLSEEEQEAQRAALKRRIIGGE